MTKNNKVTEILTYKVQNRRSYQIKGTCCRSSNYMYFLIFLSKVTYWTFLEILNVRFVMKQNDYFARKMHFSGKWRSMLLSKSAVIKLASHRPSGRHWCGTVNAFQIIYENTRIHCKTTGPKLYFTILWMSNIPLGIDNRFLKLFFFLKVVQTLSCQIRESIRNGLFWYSYRNFV